MYPVIRNRSESVKTCLIPGPKENYKVNDVKFSQRHPSCKMCRKTIKLFISVYDYFSHQRLSQAFSLYTLKLTFNDHEKECEMSLKLNNIKHVRIANATEIRELHSNIGKSLQTVQDLFKIIFYVITNVM